MNRYFKHMRTKSPHERRQHAAGVAAAATAVIAMGWLVSLAYVTPGPVGGVMAGDGSSAQDQLANAVNSVANGAPTLEVSTTSVLNNQ